MNDSTDWAAEMAARRAAMYPKAKPKRTGKTPEAKVKAQIDAYLKRIGAINIRTNAGSWQDEQGNYIQGAKAGTSDRTVCLPGVLSGGRACFAAIEDKSKSGVLSEAQKRYKARVEAIGGLFIEARSVEDVRAALVEAFGEQAVHAVEEKR